jgi:hypothetical protein
MFDSINSFERAKKQYYIDMLNGSGPFRFFNTLTFQYLISDDQGRELADIYWRRTTKNIFHRKRTLPLTSIQGIALLERAPIYENGPKSCHFHFLIKDHPVFSMDESVAIAQLMSAAWKASRNFKTFDGRTLVSEETKGIDVRSVYDDNVAGYLLKDASQFGWRGTERLFYLDKEGLISVDATPPHKMF